MSHSPTPRYIDIHALQTVPFNNLNRDDQNAPKTVSFGGVERTRISSQSWKRVMRQELEAALNEYGVRTRHLLPGVAASLEKLGWSPEDAAAGGRQVARSIGKGVKLMKEKDNANNETLVTSVLLYLPESGLDQLAEIAAQHRDAVVKEESKPDKAKPEKKGILPSDEIAAVLRQKTTVMNLFGRMLAELPGSNVDGAVQVAHAFTTHGTVPEYDFFTAVDDLSPNAGSGHMDAALFSTGTFYRYANIDLVGLAENLDGDKEVARNLVALFLRSFLLSLPTGKNTATAPSTIPDLAHVALRSDRPVSFASAFEAAIGSDYTSPARSGNKPVGFAAESRRRLSRHATQINELIGTDHLLHAAHAGLIGADDGQSAENLAGLGQRTTALNKLIDDVVANAYRDDV